MPDPVALLAQALTGQKPPAPSPPPPRGLLDVLSQTWPARLAKDAWEAVKLPGDVYQGNVSMVGEDGRTNPAVINRAADLAGLIMGGSYAAAPAMNNASGMGIKAYHSTYEPFEKYDFSKLGKVTRENTDSEWAQNLAKIGPWASDQSVAAKMAASHTLPVDIGGKGKTFKSLDQLEAAIRKNGGPEKFREKLTGEGFGHVKVMDEEFGVNSFVGLSPENFTILKDK